MQGMHVAGYEHVCVCVCVCVRCMHEGAAASCFMLLLLLEGRAGRCAGRVSAAALHRLV